MSPLFLPSSPEQVLALMAAHPQARLLAGGTDVLVRLRQQAPATLPPLIGLERVREWQGVSEDAHGLWIGAGTSFAQLAAHPLLNRRVPALVAAARCVGGPAIRNMATLGGNLCTASPAGDSLAPLYVLNAQLELWSAQGRRCTALDGWITGPGRTGLQPQEVLTRILIPHGPAPTHQHFEKIGQRQSMAIAVVNFAAALRLQADGGVADARFAWGSVGPTVLQVPEVQALLLGRTLHAALARQAAEVVAQAVTPISDLRGSAAYRRAMAGRLLQRFLTSVHG